MLKKTVMIIIFVIISAFYSFADYKTGEKPVWGILEDTAYTLKMNEFNIDLWGPVTYGISDNLQIGTMYWIWFAQIANLSAKINILNEKNIIPSISAEAYYSQFSWAGKPDDGWYKFSAFASKQLGQQMYLSLFCGYNLISGKFASDGFSNGYMIDYSADPLLIIHAPDRWFYAGSSYVCNMSKISRFSVEASLDAGYTNCLNIGVGFEFAIGDVLRTKLSLYTFVPFSSAPGWILPMIDLYWRFSVE